MRGGASSKLTRLLEATDRQGIAAEGHSRLYVRQRKALGRRINQELLRLRDEPLAADLDFLKMLSRAVWFVKEINGDWLEMFAERLGEAANEHAEEGNAKEKKDNERRISYSTYISGARAVLTDDISEAVNYAHTLGLDAEFGEDARGIIINYLTYANRLIQTHRFPKRLYRIGEGLSWHDSPDRYLKCLGYFIKGIACQRLSHKTFVNVVQEYQDALPSKTHVKNDAFAKARRHRRVAQQVDLYMKYHRVRAAIPLKDTLGLYVHDDPTSQFNISLEIALGIRELPADVVRRGALDQPH